MNSTEIRETSNDVFKEYTFYIENVKFSIIYDQGSVFTKPSPKEDGYIQLHFHSYYELFYVASGELVIRFEDGDKTFKKDDLIIMSPGINHHTVNSSSGLTRYNINFLIEKTAIKAEFSLYDSIREVLAEEYLHLENSGELRNIIKDVLTYAFHGDKMNICRSFHELIVAVLNKKNTRSAELPNAPISDSSMIRMYKLQQILFHCYAQDISLSDIANKLYLSTRQASRIIKKYYGCTYRELVTRMRMKEAAELLVTTDMSVLEISTKVGYNSIKGFYSAFKKQYACLPTQCRKANGCKDIKNNIPILIPEIDCGNKKEF